MNMSDVKFIKLPDTKTEISSGTYSTSSMGVFEIKDSSNNVLWHYTPGWATIWEGNKIISVAGNTTTENNLLCCACRTVSNVYKFRVTFSISLSFTTDDVYYISKFDNLYDPDNQPSSPLEAEIDISTADTKRYRVAIGIFQQGNIQKDNAYSQAADLIFCIDNNFLESDNYYQLGFYTYAGVGGNPPANRSITLTITKIEQYIA